MSYPGSESALLSQGATVIGLALPLLSHRVYQVVQLVKGHVDNMFFLGLLGRPMYLLLFFIKPVGFRRSFIGASTCKFTNYSDQRLQSGKVACKQAGPSDPRGRPHARTHYQNLCTESAAGGAPLNFPEECELKKSTLDSNSSSNMRIGAFYPPH